MRVENVTLHKNKIHTSELLSSFQSYSDQIKVLSLDCFDTLLWRHAVEPQDVFYKLQNKPVFKSCGFSALLRIHAETKSYKINEVKKGSSLATLDEIYSLGFESLTAKKRKALIEEELSAEIEMSYAFNPILELIREAHRQHIKIIVVSDTYLENHQLVRLLSAKIPLDVFGMIDKIFCSCDFNKNKSNGLFQLILNELQIAPHKILHIGDHERADFEAPKSLGLKTLHLYHYQQNIGNVLRIQAISAGFVNPKIRNSEPLINPYKALFSTYLPIETAEKIIGYLTLGPIMFAFGSFILQERERLKSQEKSPKIIFLMRDAYLPSLACETLCGQEIGKRVRISRFSAYAASFQTQDDVDFYLAERVKSHLFREMCQQLLLEEPTIQAILEKVENSEKPIPLFVELIKQKHILETIFNNSKQYRERLIKYLIKEINLEPGDTLLFVDLGYSGTVQNKLGPLFKKEMNVEVVGCYLLALRTHDWIKNRRGLFDASFFDDKALLMMVNFIAMIEEVCTSIETSVINFDDEGQPIFSNTSLGTEQHRKLNAIQSECLRFIADANHFKNTSLPFSVYRDYAAFSLCRFIYLPIEMELDYLKSFQFDFNLGTKELLPIFDVEAGLSSLRRRGWLFSARENLENMRMNYPAEWRATNLELSLSLMALQRFGFKFALNDLSFRREFLDVVNIHENKMTPYKVDAVLTHDGYFSLIIPVSNHSHIAIQFGLVYQWVELNSAELIPLNTLYKQSEFAHAQEASSHLMVSQMVDKGGGLFECLNESAYILFAPPVLNDYSHVLRIIFRPLVKRHK